MKHEIAFNFEANDKYVELRFPNGLGLCIDRQYAEAGITRTRSDHIAMDKLAYNDPFAYVRLMLYGDPSAWLEKNRK